MVERIITTDQSKEVIRRLTHEFGDLVFYQSGGCCEGSRPICMQKSDFYEKSKDVLFATIEGFPYYMDKDVFEYWRYSQLTLDVVDSAYGGFSLESDYEKSFIIRSRLFTEEELKELQ